MQNGKALSARNVFGETLRRNRVTAGLTTDALAELLDVSTATINAWELGRYSPRDHNLARIHDLFDSLEAQVISDVPKAEAPNAVKRGDVEAALSLSQSIEELLVTASSFTEDDQLQQFLALLLNKARNLNGRLISIKAGLRD